MYVNKKVENMIKVSDAPCVSRIKNYSYIPIVIWGAVFFILLLLRDTYSVGINKNLFVILTCICALSMKTNNLIYLFCFLFPLYVGLPGNYMTLILIIRLIFSTCTFKVTSLTLSIMISVFMFLQNIATGYTGIVPMMFIAGVVLVLLLFTGKYNLDPVPLILMYSAGVAALGYIMLTSTLNVYDLTDLMSTSFRLGSSAVNYVEEGIMNVSADPNFYGMFAIASISLALPLALHSQTTPLIKAFLYSFVIVQIVVSLIGLSRAFILILGIWFVLYLMSQKNIKGLAISFFAVVVTVIFLVNFMPDVFKTILARFGDSDMVTGNGRTTLIFEFVDAWSSNVFTVLFGIGLFRCNVHCMPLQFLFGGGLILFMLVIALVASYVHLKPTRIGFSELVPFIVTFVMMCTVPAAGLINYMFPLVLIGLTLHNAENKS